jgi:hypothetical protein
MSQYINRRVLALTVIGCSFPASFASVCELPTVGASAMIYTMCGMYLCRLSTDMQAFRRNLPVAVAVVIISLTCSYFRESSNFGLHVMAAGMGMVAYAIKLIIDRSVEN